MSQPYTIQSLVEGAVLAALTALLALIGLWIPPLQFVTNLVWTIPLVVVILRHDFRTGVMSAVVATALVFLFSDPVRAFFLVLQFGGVGLTYGVLFKKRVSAGKTFLAGSTVAAVSMVLMVLVSSWVVDLDIVGWGQQMQETIEPTIELYRQMGLLDSMKQQGYTEADVRNMLEYFVNFFQAVVPAILIGGAISFAAFNFLISRLIIGKLGYQVPAIPPFRRWQLPWYWVWGVILGLIFMLLGDFFAQDIIMQLGQNILYIYIPFLLVGGLSVVVYFFKERSWSPLLRAVVIIAAVFYMPVAGLILVSIGLFDPLFNYRRLGKELKE